MMRIQTLLFRTALLAVVALGSQNLPAAELHPWTVQAWDAYVKATEKRIAAELTGDKFLVIDSLGGGKSRAARSAIRSGQVFVEKLETRNDQDRDFAVKDGMIHHWLGAIFMPGIHLDTLLQWLQNYDQHEKYFDEIEKSKLLSRNGGEFKIFFRIRRKKIITVYYNTEHTALYRQHDATRASSRSVATRIAELDDPGTPKEREKPHSDDSGFLWRLNSYWRFQQENGGVVVECESISLSRSIPAGFGWLIRGYAESVPRESLQNTLNSIREGVR